MSKIGCQRCGGPIVGRGCLICHTRRPAICQGGCRRRLLRGRMTPNSSTICKECWQRRQDRKKKRKEKKDDDQNGA